MFWQECRVTELSINSGSNEKIIWLLWKIIWHFLIKLIMYLHFINQKCNSYLPKRKKKCINMHLHKSAYEYLEQHNLLLLKSVSSPNVNLLVGSYIMVYPQSSIAYIIIYRNVLLRCLGWIPAELCYVNTTQLKGLYTVDFNISDFPEYANRDRKWVSDKWLGRGMRCTSRSLKLFGMMNIIYTLIVVITVWLRQKSANATTGDCTSSHWLKME